MTSFRVIFEPAIIVIMYLMISCGMGQMSHTTALLPFADSLSGSAPTTKELMSNHQLIFAEDLGEFKTLLIFFHGITIPRRVPLDLARCPLIGGAVYKKKIR